MVNSGRDEVAGVDFFVFKNCYFLVIGVAGIGNIVGWDVGFVVGSGR